jgi:small subunit ribosomal protein S4
MYKLKKYKVARRLGAHLFEKTQTEKFAVRAARYVGKTTLKRGRQATDYGLQMLEKQRVRMLYGIRERQFGNYVARVIAASSTDQVGLLYELLERRLDNVVYRLGFSPTRQAARQAVSHGHIRINGTRSNIASASVRTGDIISIRPGSKGGKLFAELAELKKGFITPPWLSVDYTKGEGKVEGVPRFDKGTGLMDLGQILQFYKR